MTDSETETTAAQNHGMLESPRGGGRIKKLERQGDSAGSRRPDQEPVQALAPNPARGRMEPNSGQQLIQGDPSPTTNPR